MKHPPYIQLLCHLVAGLLKVFHLVIDSAIYYIFRCNTQLVFIPSQRDLHHHPVYPQPPYNIKIATKDLSQVNNITYLIYLTLHDDDAVNLFMSHPLHQEFYWLCRLYSTAAISLHNLTMTDCCGHFCLVH